MTALTHPIFGDLDVTFTTDSKFAGNACTLDDINRQDVVLTKQVHWWQVVATATFWLATTVLGTSERTHPPRPPSSPLTNLQAALEALKHPL